MKGSNVVSAIHHLRLASLFMQDFIRERPNGLLTRLFKNYISKIEWMFSDLKSEPALPQVVREGINEELNSDLLAVPEINNKVALLNPDQREVIEKILDEILAGKDIKAVDETIETV